MKERRERRLALKPTPVSEGFLFYCLNELLARGLIKTNENEDEDATNVSSSSDKGISHVTSS